MTAVPANEPWRSWALRSRERIFFAVLAIWVVLSAMWLVIDLRDDSSSWWFYWPMLGWGIGLVVHTLVTFGGIFSDEWRERKARQLYEKERHRAG